MKSSPSVIYDKRYYAFQAFLYNPKVIKTIQNIKSKLKKYKLEIPNNYFKSLPELNQWQKRYKEKTLKEINRQNSDFPNITKELSKLLKQNKLLTKDYLFNLKLFFNFGLNKFLRELFIINMNPNKITNEPELWVRLFPYTRVEDLRNNWDIIKLHQQQLPDYKEKYKSKPQFDKRLGVYYIYQELKILSREEINKRYGRYGLIEATAIESEKRGKPVEIENVRDIVKEFNLFFKNN